MYERACAIRRYPDRFDDAAYKGDDAGTWDATLERSTSPLKSATPKTETEGSWRYHDGAFQTNVLAETSA